MYFWFAGKIIEIGKKKWDLINCFAKIKNQNLTLQKTASNFQKAIKTSNDFTAIDQLKKDCQKVEKDVDELARYADELFNSAQQTIDTVLGMFIEYAKNRSGSKKPNN